MLILTVLVLCACGDEKKKENTAIMTIDGYEIMRMEVTEGGGISIDMNIPDELIENDDVPQNFNFNLYK